MHKSIAAVACQLLFACSAFAATLTAEEAKLTIVRTDDLGYLAIVRTAGVNQDVSHDQVVARYKAWDAKYGLVLVGAGQDWLEATFRTPPNDWLAFAKEVAAFCPDVVEQGTGSVEALAKEMSESDSVYLWWD
jgi:hypothetical protein